MSLKGATTGALRRTATSLSTGRWVRCPRSADNNVLKFPDIACAKLVDLYREMRCSFSPVYPAINAGRSVSAKRSATLFCFSNSLKFGLQATITPDEQLRVVVEALTEFIERRVQG